MGRKIVFAKGWWPFRSLRKRKLELGKLKDKPSLLKHLEEMWVFFI